MGKNSNANTIYDIIVIGAGSGGLNVAGFMNAAGFSVLLVDKRDEAIGGDCLNYGCVPSKALLHVAKRIREGKSAERFGVSMEGTPDIVKIMEYIREKQNVIRKHENADYFRKQGMDVVLGNAVFSDTHTIDVDGHQYTGKKIVIATGSRPRSLHIPGLEDVEHIHTNETIFSLKQQPSKLVVVGTGPIGVEIGQAFHAFGTDVTLVGPEFLNKEDPDISQVLQSQLEGAGVHFVLNSKASRVENGSILIAEDRQGNETKIPFDAMLVSIGRDVSVNNLQVENAGIITDDRNHIVSNSRLQTDNPDVFVCGDVVGGFMFTHAAELHAKLLIENFFRPVFKKKLSTDAMAWVTYTDPEIATFGLREKDLRTRGIRYEVLVQDFEDDDRAIVDETTYGKIKLFISPKGIVLGGTMIAHNAGELTQELMLAQANTLGVDAFMKKVYPYPTASRINRSTLFEFERRKLTHFAKKVLHWLYW